MLVSCGGSNSEPGTEADAIGVDDSGVDVSLTDEASAPGLPNFTGAFVGMACQDMSGTARAADFDWFEYRERSFESDPAGQQSSRESSS